MLSDSKGAVALSKRRGPTTKSRHVLLRHRWIQQLVASGTATVEHVSRKFMYADVLTHAAVGEFFTQCRAYMRGLLFA